tara:strand:- start:244 stop:486 length:243 start_codon:yes stop_codon:yes gene_type:complete
MRFGKGQMLRNLGQNVGSRSDLKDKFQSAAQRYFNQQGLGMLPPPALSQVVVKNKTDYLPFIIGAVATILAALIVTRSKK